MSTPLLIDDITPRDTDSGSRLLIEDVTPEPPQETSLKLDSTRLLVEDVTPEPPQETSLKQDSTRLLIEDVTESNQLSKSSNVPTNQNNFSSSITNKPDRSKAILSDSEALLGSLEKLVSSKGAEKTQAAAAEEGLVQPKMELVRNIPIDDELEGLD